MKNRTSILLFILTFNSLVNSQEMTKDTLTFKQSEINLLKLAKVDSTLMDFILLNKQSDIREYYWTDSDLYNYSNMSKENRYYVQGAFSFLINQNDFKSIQSEALNNYDVYTIRTVNGFHLYDQLEIENSDYYWGVLQKFYKQNKYSHVSLFPTNNLIDILKIHDFKFYGASVDLKNCYQIIESWIQDYHIKLDVIAVNESIVFSIENSPDLDSPFYDNCLKICGSFLENGDNWKQILKKEIDSNGQFTIFDK